jgi:ferredoxin
MLCGATTEMTADTREIDVITNDIESDWFVIRRQVLEHDHYTCQGCGISEKECYRSLDVHHIIPYNKGGLDTLDNLMTLCPKCHPGEEAKSRRLYGSITAFMKRKGRNRDGFIQRVFNIPTALDDELRMEAVRTHVRFSDIAISAFREFLGSKKRGGRAKEGREWKKDERE